jgi:hypothetical protein
VFFAAVHCDRIIIRDRKAWQNKKKFYGGVYIFFMMGCVLEQAIQVGVIQYSVKVAGMFDVFFVNSLKPSFLFRLRNVFYFTGSGHLVRPSLAQKKRWPLLRLSLWSLVFLMLATVPISLP